MSSIYLLILQGVVSSAGLVLMKLFVADAGKSVMAGRVLNLDVLGALCGAGLYVASFALWLVILSKSQLSYAYPVSVGVTLLLTASAGLLLQSETMTVSRGAGMVLIFAGLVLVNQSRI